jgi:peptide-methionine (S)-S-oxide reductase
MEHEKGIETITLGAGCFWCTEAVFSLVEGVEKVIPGYSGGHVENPTYEQVSTGETGHAEVVQVTFDPEEVSLDEILDVYFSSHDPTTLNRQGPDVGPQYRSIILYHTEEQKKKSEEFIKKLEKSGKYNEPIVTEIKPFEAFYEAEGYHKDYYEKKGSSLYSQRVIKPKVEKIKDKLGK